MWTHCVQCCYWFSWIFLRLSVFNSLFFFIELYLSHRHSQTFSTSWDTLCSGFCKHHHHHAKYNMLCLFLFYSVYTFRTQKKTTTTNKRISIELSCWISHWQKKRKLPKTFPRCNNCHVQYSATIYVFLSIILFSRAMSFLSFLCDQLFNYFVSLYDFPSSQFCFCLMKSLHLHENDITLHYQWHTLVALKKKKNINNNHKQSNKLWFKPFQSGYLMNLCVCVFFNTKFFIGTTVDLLSFKDWKIAKTRLLHTIVFCSVCVCMYVYGLVDCMQKALTRRQFYFHFYMQKMSK